MKLIRPGSWLGFGGGGPFAGSGRAGNGIEQRRGSAFWEEGKAGRYGAGRIKRLRSVAAQRVPGAIPTGDDSENQNYAGPDSWTRAEHQLREDICHSRADDGGDACRRVRRRH